MGGSLAKCSVMRTASRAIVWALALAGGAVAAHAEVHVGINIGIPAPPPFVIPAPPRLAVVPTTPAVRYAPDLEFNFFGYGGQYYTFHEGSWFVAAAVGAPWVYVPIVQVPRPIRIVPARYYRVPPPHCGRPSHRHGHGHHGDWDDDHHDHGHNGHGHGHGHGHDD
jgi:hypothetical protein